jgi:phosphoribosylanthranilate isomerase
MRVKICGLSTEETMNAALDAGADMVGLVFFAKSPRHVALDRARALAGLARGRAEIVALTVDASDDALDAIAEAVAPDLWQLHGRETPARVAAIAARGRRTIKAIGIAEAADLAAAAPYQLVADHVLFDARPAPGAVLPGGNGVPFDWRLLAGLVLARPWILSGGLNPDNVADAIASSGARAVDVSSGVERAPGVKDIDAIRAFVANARYDGAGAARHRQARG